MFFRRQFPSGPQVTTAAAAAALTAAAVAPTAQAAPTTKVVNASPPTTQHAIPASLRASASPVGLAPLATQGRYTVRAGDTVSHLALRFGVSQAAIVSANNLRSANQIFVGQALRIPGDSSNASSAPRTTKKHQKPKPRGASTYTVRPGDTMGAIAARHRVSLTALLAANPSVRPPNLVRIGHRVAIPGGTKKVATHFAGRTYPSQVTRAAQRNQDALATKKHPSREQMRLLVRKAAIKYGVDPGLAQAVSYQESGFNMNRVSPANAIGAMQVIPTSGDWASSMIGRKLDLHDPEDNATAGVLILRANIRAASSVDQALGGYYQGLASIRKHGMFADTRRYVANVRTLSTRFS